MKFKINGVIVIGIIMIVSCIAGYYLKPGVMDWDFGIIMGTAVFLFGVFLQIFLVEDKDKEQQSP